MRRLFIASTLVLPAVVGVLFTQGHATRQSAATICFSSAEIGWHDHPIVKTPVICIPAP